jgi:uncharacterized lipoprotein YbaY
LKESIVNSSAFENASLVQGEIVIDETGNSFSGATVHVRLEDTSRADAPARIVAEQVLEDVSHTAGAETRLPFALEATSVDEKSRYTVRAHVDVDGDGKVSRGDFLSMESYPVLTFGFPNNVSVQVKEL